MLIWHARKKQITWKFYTTQKMKFFIKDLVTLTEDALTKNCIFCARLVLKEVRINDKGNEWVTTNVAVRGKSYWETYL